MEAKLIIVMCTYPKTYTDDKNVVDYTKETPNVNKLIDKILSEKLAACVNKLHNIESSFIWQGKKETENEELLIIKTKSSLFEQLKQTIKSNHPYECPEIIALPIFAIDSDYEAWLKEQTS